MKERYDFTGGKRGAVVPATGKTRITLFLDDDILSAYRERAGAAGKGYQTLLNEALRATLAPEAAPVTLDSLGRVLREELHTA
jgi:uncharacterized protein (DUF4415 family)